MIAANGCDKRLRQRIRRPTEQAGNERGRLPRGGFTVLAPSRLAAAGPAFVQSLDPLHSVLGTTLVALIPIALLLVLLAVVRMTAWQAVIIGAVVTVIMAITIWHAPVKSSIGAWAIGAGTGIWSIDWITFWGVVIYNTLVETGAFEDFKRWVISQATADIRVQTILLAWSLGALLEGLVGFGYPWAVIAPILVGLGVIELDAIRVAALANNAPVSFGALGAPIIALATITGVPLLHLSASIGRIVALLALLPPWILIMLVTGRRGLRGAWPLAVTGSLAYIAGQFPTSQFLGPYLPDVIGSLVSFAALLVLLRFWRPRETLGFGGVPVEPAPTLAAASAGGAGTTGQAEGNAGSPGGNPGGTGNPGNPGEAAGGPDGARPAFRQALRGLVPFGILIVVVVAATGPWSHLGKYDFVKPAEAAVNSLSHKTSKVTWEFAPAIAGTWILVSWLIILAVLRVTGRQVRSAFRRSFGQMWGALLVAPIIFGLADVFNYAGMASSLAYGFSRIGTAFILLAPILGWIGVALSGSNTSTNALFGGFQYSVGKLLGFPLLLLPSINSVGGEVGKPVAPQTASVGVSTSSYVRREGIVIRHNMGWTLVLLGYLILLGLLFRFVLPGAMR
jgi:lactate permease